MPDQTLLGIETSCDDTCAAIMTGGRLRANVTSTQTEHAGFGGVVPEAASRAHDRLIAPVVQQALDDAGATFADLDAVAVTHGPGLSGALLVGVSYAKALALALDVPLVGVNHLEGHLASVFLEDHSPEAPFLCLIASGGHTQLLRVEGTSDLAPRSGRSGTHASGALLLGRTRDDAAGEAFDKTAKLLGLGYPGGPAMGRLAADGDATFHDFPRSRPGDYDFSFSGLKTSVLYYLRDVPEAEREAHVARHRADLCAAIQEAIVEALAGVLFEAAEETGVRHLALVGGVAANRRLRKVINTRAEASGRQLFVPRPAFCTDNAAMVCAAAHRRGLSRQPTGDALALDVDPGLALA